MTKFLRNGILAVFAFLSVLACEEEFAFNVNQDSIYTDYELFYDSDQDITRALVKFRFGGPSGTILDLGDSGQVNFNGDKLPFSSVWTGHIKEYPGKIESGTFEYTNTNGTTYINQTPVFETADIPASFDTLSKSSSTNLIWQGSSLSANQAIALFLGSQSTVFEDALFVVSSEGTNSITLSKEAVGSIANGATGAILDRQTEIEISEGTSKGGVIRSKYRAPSKTVIIKE